MQTVNKIFINGVFVTPHGTKQSELEDPATGEIITRVTLADEVDAQNAISAANAALKSIPKPACKLGGSTCKESMM